MQRHNLPSAQTTLCCLVMARLEFPVCQLPGNRERCCREVFCFHGWSLPVENPVTPSWPSWILSAQKDRASLLRKQALGWVGDSHLHQLDDLRGSVFHAIHGQLCGHCLHGKGVGLPLTYTGCSPEMPQTQCWAQKTKGLPLLWSGRLPAIPVP